MSAEDRKHVALNFRRLARQGHRDAAERRIAAGARHHRPYFQAGVTALVDAIVAAGRASPDRESDVKRVLADGDDVVVHSHVRHSRGTLGASVVQIFRFDGDRIAERWDVGQPVPADNPNADGMF